MTTLAQLLRILVVLAAALPGWRAEAQFGAFGKNKIQYHDFDWHVLKGVHVDVYYYPAEEAIARVALSYAEDTYDSLEVRLNHHMERRIPLIVYASHADFEQTNVLPFVPPEGILGVTDYLKQRVTMPFRGSYSEFRHTLRHEMVHVFQLSMAERSFSLYPRARRPGIPLWWTEGLAEYLSSPQDSRDNMVVRDLTLNANLPTIGQLNATYSPIAYPVGGDLHHFLADRYGEWRINLLYRTLWKYSSFDDALLGVYGRNAERLTEEWHFALRQRFYPAVAGRTPVGVAARKLADLALKPVAVQRGDTATEIAYLSPRSGYTNIYRVPLSGHGKARVVVAGERSQEFESFHEFFSRIDARDGVLIFGSKFGDRDALVFWDIAMDRVVGRYQFDSLVSVLSPAWSPDGSRVVFSGLSLGGVSDLYLLDIASGQLARLTNDLYEDLDPTWIAKGHSIAFSSDRAAGGDNGAANIYLIDTGRSVVTPLTSGRWRDEAPRWDSERGRILFSSDRDGTFNLYEVDTLGDGRRVTELDGGAFDPAPMPGDDRIAITAFSKLSWSLYTLQPDSQAAPLKFTLAVADSSSRWRWRELDDLRAASAESRRYRPDYTLDFAAGGSSSAPGVGNVQGGEIVISDLLGDHLIAVSLASFQSAGGAGDFLSNINANIFYLNQSQRVNWGAGVFRIAGTFYESGIRDFELYRETSIGAYAAIRYPLSRFTRVEGQVSVERSDRDDFANTLVRGPRQRTGILTGNFLSVVGDNSLWLNTGPIDGMRWNLTGGVVSDLSHGVFENWTGTGDVRKYIRTSQQGAVALRLFGYVSEGTRPRAVQLAGSWMLRGYPRYSIAGTRAWLANTEWRFPIANFVAFGFPFGVVRFPQLQGAFFADAGQAFYKDFDDRRVPGSAGVGFRMALIPGIVLRLDVGRRFSFNGDDANRDVREFYRRRFVDFFIGYNY
ncbi:MAG: DPP IV N-terminal domain-containing protein [Gemmatimonadaceae bacterium]